MVKVCPRRVVQSLLEEKGRRALFVDRALDRNPKRQKNEEAETCNTWKQVENAKKKETISIVRIVTVVCG